MLEADDDLIQRSVRTDIFMSPPADPCCSDGDSGDEDNGGTYNNLSGRQLDADAVATVRTMTSAVHIGDAYNCDDEEEQPMPVPPERSVSQKNDRHLYSKSALTMKMNSSRQSNHLLRISVSLKNGQHLYNASGKKRIYPNKADTSPIHSPISMLHLT